MGIKAEGKLRCPSSVAAAARSSLKLWMLRATTTVLLWTCVVQFTAVGNSWTWGPRVLKGWPSCRTAREAAAVTTTRLAMPEPVVERAALPPKRIYRNNGYLMVSCNGGLNQMRAAICDMVVIARSLNVTLIVPELDKTSFWNDPSEFQDIFDVEHFITSLRDEILPLIRKYKVLHLNRTDARLANNGLPLEIQRLRCRVNYSALKFTSQIEELGRRVIRMLRQNGPFLVLHLRYEMDMLAFSGCTQGCTPKETEELTRMRYAYPWWKEKVINSFVKRKYGLCPLTPEEVAHVLKALDIDKNMQIYIAAGEIYGGKRRMASLTSAYPNVVRKETLLEPSDLMFFQNHSSQMAALDYLVSLESDIFVPTYDGNMAKVVEGHRRYMGFKKTILLDRKFIVELVDQYTSGSLRWDEFASLIKVVHSNRMGSATTRAAIPDRPKEEDYFYANPQECLQGPNMLQTL
ncbi:unnamed protein product [Miscanthus lutarioriparius]|uniref:O-fucosyltransferase family protein n=1 Tax=Miscanthus lutarioriparius TaxID=422564 RepID=A0A811PED8_9POAL|nr:unnamed protein product [Miscanthus lutarioriparius]